MCWDFQKMLFLPLPGTCFQLKNKKRLESHLFWLESDQNMRPFNHSAYTSVFSILSNRCSDIWRNTDSFFRRESSQMQKSDRCFILANSNELRRRAKSRGARGAPVQVTATPSSPIQGRPVKSPSFQLKMDFILWDFSSCTICNSL